jgi:hypothetical protein
MHQEDASTDQSVVTAAAPDQTMAPATTTPTSVKTPDASTGG